MFPHKLPAMTRRAITVVALALAVSAGAPVLAVAASGPTASEAIKDCYNHDQLTRSYPPEVLRAALAQMPSDVREYSDCYDVIERQLFKELGNSGSGALPGGAAAGSSSSSFLPTWLIVVIVLLALAAITFGALAIRRRAAEPGGPGAGGPGGPVSGPGEPGPGPGRGGDPPEAGPDGPGGAGA